MLVLCFPALFAAMESGGAGEDAGSDYIAGYDGASDKDVGLFGGTTPVTPPPSR